MDTGSGSGTGSSGMDEGALNVSLFQQDTVMSALGLMQRLGRSRLPVRNAQGAHVGDVSEEELYRWWARAPLTRLGKVLEARFRGEVIEAHPRRRALFDRQPKAPERGWTH